jgi:hypothetical protein
MAGSPRSRLSNPYLRRHGRCLRAAVPLRSTCRRRPPFPDRQMLISRPAHRLTTPCRRKPGNWGAFPSWKARLRNSYLPADTCQPTDIAKEKQDAE